MSYYLCISDVSSLEFAHFDWQTNWEKYFYFALHITIFLIDSDHYLIVTNIVLHISYFGNFTKFNYLKTNNCIFEAVVMIRFIFHVHCIIQIEILFMWSYYVTKLILIPIGLSMIFSSQIGYHWEGKHVISNALAIFF